MLITRLFKLKLKMHGNDKQAHYWHLSTSVSVRGPYCPLKSVCCKVDKSCHVPFKQFSIIFFLVSQKGLSYWGPELMFGSRVCYCARTWLSHAEASNVWEHEWWYYGVLKGGVMVKTLHDILFMTFIRLCLCPVIRCVCTLNFCLLLKDVMYPLPPKAIRPLLAHYPCLSVSVLRWKTKCGCVHCGAVASFHCWPLCVTGFFQGSVQTRPITVLIASEWLHLYLAVHVVEPEPSVMGAPAVAPAQWGPGGDSPRHSLGIQIMARHSVRCCAARVFWR